MMVAIGVCVLVLFCVLVAVVFEVREEHNRRNQREWLEEQGTVCAMQMYRTLYDDEAQLQYCAQCSPATTLRLLHSVCTLASGYSRQRVQRLAQELDLVPFMRRCTLRGLLCQRAVYALEVAQTTLDADLHPTNSENPFGRVLTAVAISQLTDDGAVLRSVTRHRLNPIQRSLILEIRNRRVGVMDYHLALRSLDSLVVSFGLSAVRRFRDERVVGQVAFLVDTRDDYLLQEALYTLVTLHAPLPRLSISRAVARLDSTARRRLYRLLVAEGYSLAMLESLCDEESSSSLCDFVMGLCESHRRRLDSPVAPIHSL